MTEKDNVEVVDGFNEDDGFDNGNDFKFDVSWHKTSSWSWGLILILGGVFLLLDNMGILSVNFHNWWAIFILAPGISMIGTAVQNFRSSTPLSKRARTRGLLGVLITTFALSLFFDLSMTYIWPVLLVGFGIYLLVKK